MKIAALSCVYNQERWLKNWFEHIKPHVDEFIILDDGSTDSSLSIIKQYTNNIIGVIKKF